MHVCAIIMFVFYMLLSVVNKIHAEEHLGAVKYQVAGFILQTLSSGVTYIKIIISVY